MEPRRADDPASEKIVHDYLLAHEPVFRTLAELREKVNISGGWANPLGDQHFEVKRDRADNADDLGRMNMFDIMRQIGNEMENATQIFSSAHSADHEGKILDLCMAPGGYSACAFKNNPGATVRGITLHTDQGGYPLLLVKAPYGCHLTFKYGDITMLAKEFGVNDIPSGHPNAAKFSTERLFEWDIFDLVLCDGQVLRTDPTAWRCKTHEDARLRVSQLIFALKRIKVGGSLIACT